MDEKILLLAGLTRNEAKVYLTLLDDGPSLAGSIAKHSGIHRRSVYDLLARLAEKGLVSYIVERKRKRYEATNPAHVIELMKQAQEDVEKIMPSLLNKFNTVKEKQETVFYRGKEGVKTILADQLAAKEILVLGASPQAQEIIKYYFHKYDEARKKKHIQIRMIFNQRPSYPIPLSTIRYLPLDAKAAVNIYGSKVAIILWTEKPLGILINNSGIADAFRQYFELLWGIAKDFK
ncbi:hypothetical protein HY639_01175 [Candidatus Woesearchaeota archaeon]|nr:hypothetical protein [Candidatus Woesearchaeota archaeon]